MTIDLHKTLEWGKANADELAMLDDLQGNILKGHGRDYTHNLFLHFDASDAGRPVAQRFVAELAAELTTARAQLEGAAAFKQQCGKDAGLFLAFFLTARGYGALGRTDLKPTLNAKPFEDGLKERSITLFDPPVDTWEAHFQDDIHAMVLIADDHELVRNVKRFELLERIAKTEGAVTLVGEEEGRAMRNPDGHGIEHFGYVDGRSQPLVLKEDVEEEDKQHGGIDQWDPTIELAQLLVPSPGGRSANSHGSYFVFRKLEENVRGFKKMEKQLAKFLELGDGLVDPDRIDAAEELAGAMVIGRFENGQPTALHDVDGDLRDKDVPNNFNYRVADPKGLKCPFAGHIRKSNPRGESETKFHLDPGTEILHLMARRGITYGQRAVDPNTPDLRFEDMPTGDVGLLFMAYQSDLADQFEFTQRSWVNNPDFVNGATGIDPVIGQAPTTIGQQWPAKWGATLDARRFDFSGFVTMLGGDYFFAPSISTLQAIAR